MTLCERNALGYLLRCCCHGPSFIDSVLYISNDPDANRDILSAEDPATKNNFSNFETIRVAYSR